MGFYGLGLRDQAISTASQAADNDSADYGHNHQDNDQFEQRKTVVIIDTNIHLSILRFKDFLGYKRSR